MTINVDVDVDITPRELIRDNRYDMEDLIDELLEDKHFKEMIVDKLIMNESLTIDEVGTGKVRAYDEEVFIKSLKALSTKWNCLTAEEEETILKIAKRF